MVRIIAYLNPELAWQLHKVKATWCLDKSPHCTIISEQVPFCTVISKRGEGLDWTGPDRTGSVRVRVRYSTVPDVKGR
jgi:hypothetical protein